MSELSPSDLELFTEGPYARARVSDRPPCPLCQGSGLRVVVQEGVEVAGRCRCQLAPDRAERFNQAHLPARHLGSTLESFNLDRPGVTLAHQAVVSWVQRYGAESPQKGLVLYGEVGRGKTHLLVAALRRLTLGRGVPCRFVEFTHLLADLRDGFERGQSQASLLSPLARVEVLAIDELGKGRCTDWELSIVDELISRRYNAMRTTLATTNFGVSSRPARGRVEEASLATPVAQTLADRVGDRVYSRLREMCAFVPVVGSDYRIGADRGLRG